MFISKILLSQIKVINKTRLTQRLISSPPLNQRVVLCTWCGQDKLERFFDSHIKKSHLIYYCNCLLCGHCLRNIVQVSFVLLHFGTTYLNKSLLPFPVTSSDVQQHVFPHPPS